MKKIILFFLLTIMNLYSQDFTKDPECKIFQKEGDFVEGPANAGYYVFAVPGVIVGCGLIIVSIFSFNSDMMNASPEYPLLGGLTGRIGYYFVGGLFYTSKKVFYDIPKKTIEQTKKTVRKFSKSKSP